MFGGVWKRTKLEEPRGILGSNLEQIKTILWIQSYETYFIDLRVLTEREIDDNHEKKSFAGIMTYNENNHHITWTRCLDYRPLGPPDIGEINFLNENEIEEDGVLPGDDYKEIWFRISRCSESDVTSLISIRDLNGLVIRSGYFLIVGDYFALTLSRSLLPSPESQQTANVQLREYFNENKELPSEWETYLDEYVTVVGQTSDWIVQHSLHREMQGCSIFSPQDCQNETLKFLLHNLSWEFIKGNPPAIWTNWSK